MGIVEELSPQIVIKLQVVIETRHAVSLCISSITLHVKEKTLVEVDILKHTGAENVENFADADCVRLGVGKSGRYRSDSASSCEFHLSFSNLGIEIQL